MADIASKTWSFTTDLEGLTDQGNSNDVVFQRNATDASAQFAITGRNKSGTESARTPDDATSWETWGVPSGRTITRVRCAGWKKKISVYNVVDATGPFQIRVLSGTNVIATLVNVREHRHGCRRQLHRPARRHLADGRSHLRGVGYAGAIGTGQHARSGQQRQRRRDAQSGRHHAGGGVRSGQQSSDRVGDSDRFARGLPRSLPQRSSCCRPRQFASHRRVVSAAVDAQYAAAQIGERRSRDSRLDTHTVDRLIDQPADRRRDACFRSLVRDARVSGL